GDLEIRAQAAKTLGNLRTALAYDAFVALLKDESPRVRFFAAMGLGKIGKREALPAVIEFLRANDNGDRMLQHAGIMALTWIEDIDAIVKASADESPAVRMAAIVALRKLKHPLVVRFHDEDPRIILESARAVYDTPIPEALHLLADRATSFGTALNPELFRKVSIPYGLRVVNAAFRIGKADLVAALATDQNAPSPVRIEALKVLGEWENPSGRDRLLGLWRPIPGRPKEEAILAIRPRIGSILREGPPDVASEAARLVATLRMDGISSTLREWLKDPQASAEARASALRALAELK